jgi:hypothetical protein
MSEPPADSRQPPHAAARPREGRVCCLRVGSVLCVNPGTPTLEPQKERGGCLGAGR